MAGAGPCVFCQIASSSTSTQLLHSDEKVVAFQDINPSAFKHYLVIPVEHISTVKDLQRRMADYQLVSHLLDVGQTLLHRDAPDSKQYSSYLIKLINRMSCLHTCHTSRFGFHQPPFNSVNHLHLHCLALPFIPRWKCIKYMSLGPFGGFIKAEKLLKKINP
ncbi:bifunctional adenosine 5'-phosphosulfate phosphorylase/adenylylsulfatase HINT4-like isoform X3 [Macadamia integrifolia]|uniref:bifunctional adenosine 5'-phosphosulfate phosphorylase/adenylylsulfatase HINT4-like isoform X3 n=1 Tax=Macadamia integrifolia TaxID=60698 RepID=UPI001C4E7759|nr:bifunctional adenosine 5'-phosphosulfate phosphorylase/adenylylsulfatase HINT4-like isoform X3 [Macadamia integrifolia]XP_042503852.1 bifunctional adenosine 5'-phosphosulfate phosphorylase/adenylylsulfatase HINT4-like isoform X3 [Macadamia integrifolia]XP_042503853.1 bifunctional adenosine 5'-phosphosulfate phosphorylase/adenylylsulfatase HINT4-like isoform X3 [Macadamia integrifolia]